MIVRLGQYISFTNNNGVAEDVEYSNEALEGNYIMMQEVGGSRFVCKIRSNVEDIDNAFINSFLKAKAEANIDKAFKLKIKDALESDEAFENELESILEDKGLGRKEEKAFEKQYIEDKIEEIAYNEKLIKPGSIVRLPISSSKDGDIEIDGTVYPIYESLCLIMKENNEISESGIYYVSQNRHGIPLRLRSSFKDMDVYFWETNNELITKEEFVTILNHGIRTIEHGNNFYLYCRAYNTEYETLVKDYSDEYSREPDETLKNKKYLEMINRFIELADEKEDFHSSVIISLPTRIQRDFVKRLEHSVLSKQPMAITNILFKNDSDKEQKAVFVEQELEKYLRDKERHVPLYGLYSIISTYNDLESDTYGFLKNNLKPSSIIMGLEDYVEFIRSIKDKDREGFSIHKEYESAYLNSDLNADGCLDI